PRLAVQGLQEHSGRGRLEQRVAAGVQQLAKPKTRLGKRLAPYLLIMPGGLWLLVFFLIPIVFMLSVSLQTGNLEGGFAQTWHFHRYIEVFQQYRPQMVRSFAFGTIATAITLLFGYPLAYWIAFHGGRHKTTFLFLLLLPFFVSFVIRILSWQFILADEGIVLGTLKDLHLVPSGLHVLSTPGAVIAGLTYDAMPFMALPIYVSLEHIDRAHVEAAADLYASPSQRFLRVILPLSAPGVYAGILLVAITNIGDYVNA